MRPTTTGLGVLLLGVAATTAGLLAQVSEALAAGLLCGLVLAVTGLAVLLAPPGRAERAPVDRAQVGEPLTLTYVTGSPGRPARGPRTWLVVTDLVDAFDGDEVRPRASAGGAQPSAGGVRATVVPTRRGVRGLGPVRVSRTDCLGLWRSSGTGEPAGTVLVLPRRVPLQVPGRLPGASGAGTRSGAAEGALTGVRPYADGDERRAVHWLSTARAGSLMVRQFGSGGRAELEVRLDTGTARYRDDAEFDRAVALTAGIVTACLTGGVPCTVRTSGGQVWGGRGPGDEPALLEQLARLRADTSAACDPAPTAGRRTVLVGAGPVATDPAVLALPVAGSDEPAVLAIAARAWAGWLLTDGRATVVTGAEVGA